jgi:hypothetical protein
VGCRLKPYLPPIAAVNGLAFGDGFEIAPAIDIIIAAEHAAFGLPEPRVGMMSGLGGVHRLPPQIYRYFFGHKQISCDSQNSADDPNGNGIPFLFANFSVSRSISLQAKRNQAEKQNPIEVYKHRKVSRLTSLSC